MQHPWLTALARSARTTPSRRTALTTLLGGLPGLLLTAGIVETVAKNKKGKKDPRRRRKKRPCRALDKPGKNCRCLKAGARCTSDANCCPGTTHRSCQEGICQPCDVCAAGCAFTSVQAAIDAAASGDTIYLCPGIFADPLTIDISKDLTLTGVGDGAGGTTLDGRGFRTVLVANATVTLERVRIIGGRTSIGGGILSRESTLTLRACTVSGNTAEADGGGIFIQGGCLTLADSRVEGNRAGGEGGGIFRESGTVTLQNSVVTNNSPDNCVGVDGCA